MSLFGENRQRWGLARAIYSAAMRRLQNIVGLHVFAINSRPLDPNAAEDPLPPDESIRYLRYADVDAICANPMLGISQQMAASALARGDVCIAYFDRGQLVSYFWCGFTTTPMEAGLSVRVPNGYSYAYKAMTLPSHRGRHLQQKLTRANDRHLCREGYRFNIEYIATHNFAQRVASLRYGNRTVGYAGYVNRRGRIWVCRSPGAKRHGFEMLIPN